MKTTTISDEKSWFIAGSQDGTVHYGELEPGQVVATGQAALAVFSDRTFWLQELSKWGVTEADVDAKAAGIPAGS